MPRFIPLSASAPVQSGAPGTPAQRFVPSTPFGGLGGARFGTSLLGLGANLTNQPLLGTATQGVGGILNIARGAQLLGQGRTVPGALAISGGVGGLGSAAGRFVPMSGLSAGGNTLGGLAGLAGGVYGLSQGDLGSGLGGTVSGLGHLANLAGPGATLGGVPLSLAGGANAGLAATEAGIGLGAGEVLGGAVPSIAAGLSAIGIPLAIGSIAHMIASRSGPTPLPFGRGNNFSSADNLASQISQFRGLGLANKTKAMIQGAKTPWDLLDLASMGRNPNWSAVPTGELQFTHAGTPTPDAYRQMLDQLVATGDPNLLRQFISGVSVQSGEGGAAKPNYQLTDWFRRKFVSLLPEGNPLRQDMTGLFQPEPPEWSPESIAANTVGDIQALANQIYGGGGYTRDSVLQALLAGTGGNQGGLAPLFRTVGVSPERAQQLAAGFQPWSPGPALESIGGG